jgi:hypothetical protein
MGEDYSLAATVLAYLTTAAAVVRVFFAFFAKCCGQSEEISEWIETKTIPKTATTPKPMMAIVSN